MALIYNGNANMLKARYEMTNQGWRKSIFDFNSIFTGRVPYSQVVCTVYSSSCSETTKRKSLKNMKHSPKNHVLQVKGVLYNSRCGHPDPQNILLRWQIRSRSDSVQIVQIAIGSRTTK